MKFDGVLFFPVTPFKADGTVDVEVLKEHITSRLPFGPGGVFPACGTGEFHALSIDEVRTVVTAAVEAVAGQMPVVAGAGGPLGHALEAARAAGEAGADALLVLPPYLVTGPTDGLVAYIEAVADASSLPVIVYHRGNAKFTAASMARLAKNRKVIGLKDGLGDVGLAQEIVTAIRATGRTDFLLFNGLLTAELTQGAYRGLGIPLYSSAAFAMAPEIAKAYYDAYTNGDEDRRNALLEGFYAPLVRLRDQTPGFGVSLIKAGLRLSGLAVGSVRPPLVDPTEGEHGIRVNGINPDGVVRGSGIFAGGWGAKRAAVYGVDEENLGEYYAQRTLLKREVLPEHVANAAAVLTSNELSHTTGLHIPVDAGVAAAFLR